jgi:hypothetical protein
MGPVINLYYSIACYLLAAILVAWLIHNKRKDYYAERYPNEKPSIFISPKYKCKFARSQAEINNMIEDGYEYVCDYESSKVFRKKV